MRMLHVATSADELMGGSVRAPLNIAKVTAAAGCDVTFAATWSPQDSTDYLLVEYQSLNVELFPRTTPKHNFRSPKLAKWLKQNARHYDLVALHGVFSFPMVYAATACASSGVPYVIHPHGQFEPYDMRKKRTLKKMFGLLLGRRMVRGAAGLLMASPMEAENSSSFGCSPDVAVCRLPLGTLRAGQRTTFRRENRIPDNAIALLHLGRLDEKKGLKFSLGALKELKSRGIEAILVIAGSGTRSEENELDVQIEHEDCADQVRRLGFVSGQPKWDAIAGSDVFLLPSLNENFGIALVEAVALGLPAVVSNEVYAADELAKFGALEYCEQSPDSIVKVIETIYLDQEKLKSLQIGAQRASDSLLSPDAVAQRLLEEYSAMASRVRND